MKKSLHLLFIILTVYFSLFVIQCKAQTPQLWGMTSYGGTNNLGTIIKLNADGSQLQAMYSFGTIPNTSSGSHPYNDLFQASDGKLYGLTYDGGFYNYGTLFSYDITSNIFTKLVDFNTTIGINPVGTLVQTNNGKLYGLTTMGGVNNEGVLFSFDINSHIYSD